MPLALSRSVAVVDRTICDACGLCMPLCPPLAIVMRRDGLIVDAEGCVWVALWQGSAVRRYAPDGRLDRHIDLPVSCPTKCAFGGDELDTIFVTSARTALSPDDLAREPQAGSVFAIRAGVRGRHANRAR